MPRRERSISSPFRQPFSQSASQIACVTKCTAVCTHSGALRQLPHPAKINKYCMFQALNGYLDSRWLILLQLVRAVTKFREGLGDILSKWIKPLFMPTIHCTHISFHGHYSFIRIKSRVMNFRCDHSILKTVTISLGVSPLFWTFKLLPVGVPCL